jgi:hypothetical protein
VAKSGVWAEKSIYGKDVDVSESGTNIFFLTDAPVEERGQVKLGILPERELVSTRVDIP